MRVEVLGCYGGESSDCRLTSLLLNGTVALDTGSLCQSLSVERQMAVRSVVLSHAHIDHTCGLPFFIDNVFGRGDGLDVHASEVTIEAVRRNLFNSAIWPDFSRLPNHLVPAVRFQTFESEQTFQVGEVRFTPIEVNHPVPTHGFLLEQDEVAVLWSSDTGPTDRLWEVANRTPHLRALCIDVSFDDARSAIGEASGHLSPGVLARELEKLERDVPILIHHMKPAFVARIRSEIGAWRRPNISFLEQGRSYDF